jgi:hypothetical protein
MIGQQRTETDSAEESADVDPGQGPAPTDTAAPRAREIGGREGPEPTRYGDWEKNGRCIDF